MMDEQKLDKLITIFNAELQAKGYRGNFTLVINDCLFTEFTGDLYGCLQQFKKALLASGGVEDTFRLYTYAYFNSFKDYIHCTLQVSASEAFGLSVTKITLEDAATGKSISERLHSNEQLPHLKKLKAKFPRPGLWQKLRGRKMIF